VVPTPVSKAVPEAIDDVVLDGAEASSRDEVSESPRTDPVAVVAALVKTNSGLPVAAVVATEHEAEAATAVEEQPPAPIGSPVDEPSLQQPSTEPEIPEWVSAHNAVEVTKTLSATAVMSLVGLLVVFMLAALFVLT